VFGIGEYEGALRLWVEDVGGQLQEFRGDLRDGAGRGTGSETDRLSGIGIKAEECLGDFVSGLKVFVFVASHLAFAVAGESVRINNEKLSAEVATGAAEFPQGTLEVLRLGGGV
jgi:hypothetical protein